LKKRKKQHFVHYDLVLADYGGDTDKARKTYRKALIEEMVQGQDIHEQIIGQTVLGGEKFLGWLKGTYLSEEKDREAPAHRAIMRQQSQEVIVETVVGRTGKTFEEIKKEKGTLRQIVMDLLHRRGGLTNPEIGRLFGVDYSAVSQERKRLRKRMENDQKLSALHRDLEGDLSRLKKRPL
jgi:hypothetical protein